MRRNTSPPTLLISVSTRFAVPSGTGYAASHAISKNSGIVDCRNIVPIIIETYNDTTMKIILIFIFQLHNIAITINDQHRNIDP
jgi:hypothetical protein